LKKPSYTPTPEREAELERLPVQIASEQEWTVYRLRDDSLVVDFFQGQFRNRLQCMTCKHVSFCYKTDYSFLTRRPQTSTTYNAFMYLTLPIPTKSSKVSLYQCLDTFVQQEVMEKSDAW
jgi:ubiquitin carboxyl-terminal hydrolase 8